MRSDVAERIDFDSEIKIKNRFIRINISFYIIFIFSEKTISIKLIYFEKILNFLVKEDFTVVNGDHVECPWKLDNFTSFKLIIKSRRIHIGDLSGSIFQASQEKMSKKFILEWKRTAKGVRFSRRMFKNQITPKGWHDWEGSTFSTEHKCDKSHEKCHHIKYLLW